MDFIGVHGVNFIRKDSTWPHRSKTSRSENLGHFFKSSVPNPLPNLIEHSILLVKRFFPNRYIGVLDFNAPDSMLTLDQTSELLGC